MGRCPTFTIDVDRCCLSLNMCAPLADGPWHVLCACELRVTPRDVHLNCGVRARADSLGYFRPSSCSPRSAATPFGASLGLSSALFSSPECWSSCCATASAAFSSASSSRASVRDPVPAALNVQRALTARLCHAQSSCSCSTLSSAATCANRLRSPRRAATQRRRAPTREATLRRPSDRRRGPTARRRRPSARLGPEGRPRGANQPRRGGSPPSRPGRQRGSPTWWGLCRRLAARWGALALLEAAAACHRQATRTPLPHPRTPRATTPCRRPALSARQCPAIRAATPAPPAATPTVAATAAVTAPRASARRVEAAVGSHRRTRSAAACRLRASRKIKCTLRLSRRRWACMELPTRRGERRAQRLQIPIAPGRASTVVRRSIRHLLPAALSARPRAATPRRPRRVTRITCGQRGWNAPLHGKGRPRAAGALLPPPTRGTSHTCLTSRT